jgi:hypothetical protein
MSPCPPVHVYPCTALHCTALHLHTGSEIEINNFRAICRRNVIEAMQILILGMNRFEKKWSTDDTEEAARKVMVIEPLQNEFWSEEFTPLIKQLWKTEPAIKDVYQQRNLLQLQDSAA